MPELAAAIKVHPRSLEDWETGKQRPPFSKAEQIAQKLHVPFGYLFLSSPPAENIPIPDLRTVGDAKIQNLSADFLDLLYDVLLKQQWYSDYLRDQRYEKLSIVGKFSSSSSVEDVAADIAETLEINEAARAECHGWEGFLRYIARSAEDVGILVMQRGIVGNFTNRPLSVDEFRGFAIVDQFAPVVFINSRDAKPAKNFTLVHELCHLWIGQSGISNLNLRSTANEAELSVERFCNYVAAEVLVPRAELSRRWQVSGSLDERVQVLSRHFCVSRYVLVRQAYASGKISYPQYSSYLNRHPSLWQPPPKDEQGGGDFYLTLTARNGRRFVSSVVGALAENQLSLRAASDLLNVKVPTLKKIAGTVG